MNCVWVLNWRRRTVNIVCVTPKYLQVMLFFFLLVFRMSFPEHGDNTFPETFMMFYQIMLSRIGELSRLEMGSSLGVYKPFASACSRMPHNGLWGVWLRLFVAHRCANELQACSFGGGFTHNSVSILSLVNCVWKCKRKEHLPISLSLSVFCAACQCFETLFSVLNTCHFLKSLKSLKPLHVLA
jgi:hypothetical protein